MDPSVPPDAVGAVAAREGRGRWQRLSRPWIRVAGLALMASPTLTSMAPLRPLAAPRGWRCQYQQVALDRPLVASANWLVGWPAGTRIGVGLHRS